MNFDEFYPDTWATTSQAARAGDLEALKVLIQKSKPTNIQDNKGWRALHHAANFGHIECIKLLLEARDVDVNAVTFERETALYLACTNPLLEITTKLSVARLLLEARADPNVENRNRYKTLLNEVICHGSVELLQLLIDYKIDINETDDYFGSCLNAVAMEGTVEMVNILFKQRLVWPDPKNCNFTFFESICVSWHTKGHMLQHFLKKPECLKYINQNEGRTPIYLACKAGWREGTKLLLNYGADPNIRSHFGELPLFVFFPHIKEEDIVDYESAFHLLWRLTNKLEFKRKSESLHYSIVHSIVHSGTKYWKELFGMLEETILNVHIASGSVKVVDVRGMDRNLANRYLNRLERTVSPLALWCSCIEKQVDLDLFHYLIEKEKDLNNCSNGKIPPFLTAVTSVLSLKNIPLQWQKNMCTLMKMGADPLITLSQNEPLPTAFMIALHENPSVLEFLLLHTVPPEIIFTQEALNTILRDLNDVDLYEETFLEMIHNDDRMRNRFSFNLPQSMTRTVKFLTISLPNKVISQLSRRIAIGTSSFPGLGPDILDRNRVRKDIQSGKLRSFAPMKVFKNALKTPKTLCDLAALRVRRKLWDTGKYIYLSLGVNDLCRQLKLTPAIQELLMLKSEFYYEKINN